MKHYWARAIALLLCLPLSAAWAQKNVVFSHDGVEMTRQELVREIERWTPEMQQAAANDLGDRLELLNKSLVAKKIAEQAHKVKAQDNPELYWKIRFKIQDELEQIMLQNHLAELEVPDMNDLAEERYTVERDRWARLPEERISSHILVLCEGPSCDLEAAEARAKEIAAKLDAGEDFGELAAQYSDDPGSKDKGGRFERWIPPHEKEVAREYVEALYELEAEGDISPVVRTRFGYHIIRLDEVKPSTYLSLEEARPRIVAYLENEYRTEAMRTYVRSFDLDDSAFIDGKQMEKIFEKYKTQP